MRRSGFSGFGARTWRFPAFLVNCAEEDMVEFPWSEFARGFPGCFHVYQARRAQFGSKAGKLLISLRQ
jgi:hypothetical protein